MNQSNDLIFAPVAVFHKMIHMDEAYRAIIVWLLGSHTFDLDGERTEKMVTIKMASQGEFTEEQADTFRSRLKWLFFGNHGGENDEHSDDVKELASVDMPLEGMTQEQFRTRFDAVMLELGVEKSSLDLCFERLVDDLFYTGFKDANYNARMLGTSWTFKWVARTISALINEDRSVGDAGYTEEHLRDGLRMARHALVARMFTSPDYHSGVEPAVESLLCRVIRDFRGIWWHKGWFKGITLTDIIEQLEGEKKKDYRLIRMIGELRNVLYGSRNMADYGNIDHWIMMHHLVSHPKSQLPFVLDESMTIENVIEKLEELPKDEKARNNLLSVMRRLLEQRSSEQDMREKCGDDPRLDERTWECPHNFHNMLWMLLELDEEDEIRDCFHIEEKAYDYCMAAISAWYMHRRMSYLGEGEASKECVIPVSNDWDEAKYGRPVPTMQVFRSSNMRTVAMSRRNGVSLQVNFKPDVREEDKHNTYVGLDQLDLGDEFVDEVIRSTIVPLRILEYRMREMELPDSLEDFRTTSMCDDLCWFLASKKWAFGVYNGTDHHPDVPPSMISESVVEQVVWLVFAISWMEDEEQNEEYDNLLNLVKNEDIKWVMSKLLKMKSRLLST